MLIEAGARAVFSDADFAIGVFFRKGAQVRAPIGRRVAIPAIVAVETDQIEKVAVIGVVAAGESPGGQAQRVERMG